MRSHRLSRRQLLGGFLSGLLGWGWAGRGRGTTPTSQPAPQGPGPQPLGPQITAYVYDGRGRFCSEPDILWAAGSPFVCRWSYDASGQRSSGTDAA